MIAERTLCACSTDMIEVKPGGLQVCPHCDLPCPNLKKGCRYCGRMEVKR